MAEYGLYGAMVRHSLPVPDTILKDSEKGNNVAPWLLGNANLQELAFKSLTSTTTTIQDEQKTFCAGMHRKSMEVAQHYTTNHDSSEHESSSDFTDLPKNNNKSENAGGFPNGTTSASSTSEFAVAAAAAAAAAMASEDFRSHSIAALRARAQQHSARLQEQDLHEWNNAHK